MYQSNDSMPPLMSYQSQSITSIIPNFQKWDSTLNEIDNITNDQIQEQITKFNNERTLISENIKLLRISIKKQKSSSSLDKELKLLTDQLYLIQKLLHLYKDKLQMRLFITNQQQCIRHLSEQVIDLENKMKQELSKIQQYSNMHSTQRETECHKEITLLKQQLENEKYQRIKLEENIEYNVDYVSRLFNEAEQSKQIIIEQLKEIKLKKDNLDQQMLIFQDEKQIYNENLNKQQQQILKENEFTHNHKHNNSNNGNSFSNNISNLSEQLRKQQQLQITSRNATQRIFD